MIACCMIMVLTNGEADVFGFFLIGFGGGNNAYESGSVVG